MSFNFWCDWQKIWNFFHDNQIFCDVPEQGLSSSTPVEKRTDYGIVSLGLGDMDQN